MTSAKELADQLPGDAVGLKLHRIDRNENLLSCEEVYFQRGYTGVELALRRAALSGRVEVGGVINNHFADVLTSHNGDWSETVALDAKSYSALKNHWMRCKLDDNTQNSFAARKAKGEQDA